ncbi:peptide chain release factor N(5)-glutamine methyltransferase [Patescibacteria group bacterium]
MELGVMTTVSEILKESHELGLPRRDAELVICHTLNISYERCLSHPEHILSSDEQRACRINLKRLQDNESVAAIRGAREFYSLDFVVNRDVLVPRPETEALVEYIIRESPENAVMLDIGTGSGCIAISVAKNRPDIHVTAIDASSKALRVATRNAESNDVASQITFLKSNLLKNLPQQQFDVIAANLPYLDPSWAHPTTQHEPPEALFAGENGLELYLQLLPQLKDYMHKTTHIILEADPRNIEALADSFKEIYPKMNTSTRKDDSNKLRFLTAQHG